MPTTIYKFSFLRLKGILSQPKSVAKWQQTWQQKAREAGGKLIALRGKNAVRGNDSRRIWIACSIIVKKESWHQRLIYKHWYGALCEDAFFRLRVSNVGWNEFPTDIVAAVLRGRETAAQLPRDADHSERCVAWTLPAGQTRGCLPHSLSATWCIGTERTDNHVYGKNNNAKPIFWWGLGRSLSPFPTSPPSLGSCRPVQYGGT